MLQTLYQQDFYIIPVIDKKRHHTPQLQQIISKGLSAAISTRIQKKQASRIVGAPAIYHSCLLT